MLITTRIVQSGIFYSPCADPVPIYRCHGTVGQMIQQTCVSGCKCFD